ncbi:MAG TPA: ankyrin repeat domain-containing protein [Crenalkalicoccus sp.]|nr:ankyrin repeat domain-containing protein [Crenalkalicoccus sp.]
MQDAANPFLAAVRDGDLAAVRRLLAADPTLVGVAYDDGATPLSMAARLDRLEVLRALIEAGAVDRPDSDPGQAPTALMEAAAKGHAEAVALLLEHGAEAGRRDALGRTAADHAEEAGHAELAARLRPGVDAERTVWSGPPTDRAPER